MKLQKVGNNYRAVIGTKTYDIFKEISAYGDLQWYVDITDNTGKMLVDDTEQFDTLGQVRQWLTEQQHA